VNKQIARLALVGVALLAALIVATTYWQTWATAGLADRQDNEIQRVAEFSIKRGLIRAADGTILATRRAASSRTSSATRRSRARARGSKHPRTTTSPARTRTSTPS